MTTPRLIVRFSLIVVLVAIVVSLPFVIWGDEHLSAWLQMSDLPGVVWVLVGVLLLMIDPVAPIPSTIVVAVVAARAGVAAGILAGTIGMTAGVAIAWWLGRTAIRRVNTVLFSESERERVDAALQRSAGWTLICLRPLPVLAETSVLLAGAGGISFARTLLITLLPNFLIASIYSMAAQHSWRTAVIAIATMILLSGVAWWVSARRARPPIAS